MQRHLSNRVLLPLTTLVPLLGACATVSPGSRPDDMSAVRHRAVAKEHDRKAEKQQTQYNPKAVAFRSRGGGVAGIADVEDFDIPYNPTKVHLANAREHREHAHQHRAAARALERFEGESCHQFSKENRVVCPLLGQVRRVQNTPKGARLYLVEGVPAKAVLAHMKCHYAYGRVIARKGMQGCPLYLKHLTFRASQDDAFVEISSEDAEVVSEIQRRSKLHVVP